MHGNPQTSFTDLEKEWLITIKSGKNKKKSGVVSKLQQVVNCEVKSLSASRISFKFRVGQNVESQHHDNSPYLTPDITVLCMI